MGGESIECKEEADSTAKSDTEAIEEGCVWAE